MRAIQGAASIPIAVIPTRITIERLMIALATSHARSRPSFSSSSTNTGTNTDVRIPPSTNS
jgi:hypothetical protein